MMHVAFMPALILSLCSAMIAVGQFRCSPCVHLWAQIHNDHRQCRKKVYTSLLAQEPLGQTDSHMLLLSLWKRL